MRVIYMYFYSRFYIAVFGFYYSGQMQGVARGNGMFDGRELHLHDGWRHVLIYDF